jgi:phosphate uptake regulator
MEKNEERMFDLGPRKTQLVGGSFMLCLPNIWARTNTLEKGDELSVKVDTQGRLVVEKNEKGDFVEEA